MAHFLYLDPNLPPPYDLKSPVVPVGSPLVSALDQVVLDLAKNLNGGQLIVSDLTLSGQMSTSKFTNGMYPMYFAPGLNSSYH